MCLMRFERTAFSFGGTPGNFINFDFFLLFLRFSLFLKLIKTNKITQNYTNITQENLGFTFCQANSCVI